MTWSFAVAGSAKQVESITVKSRITVQEENNGQRKSKEKLKCPQSFCAENDGRCNEDLVVEQTADHVEDSSRKKTHGIQIHAK